VDEEADRTGSIRARGLTRLAGCNFGVSLDCYFKYHLRYDGGNAFWLV